MSDTQPNVGRLLDAQGDAVRRNVAQAQGTVAEVRDYIREQPFSAALLAIAFGYIIGRLRII